MASLEKIRKEREEQGAQLMQFENLRAVRLMRPKRSITEVAATIAILAKEEGFELPGKTPSDLEGLGRWVQQLSEHRRQLGEQKSEEKLKALGIIIS